MSDVKCPNCSRVYRLKPEAQKILEAKCPHCRKPFSLKDNRITNEQQEPEAKPQSRTWTPRILVMAGIGVLSLGLLAGSGVMLILTLMSPDGSPTDKQAGELRSGHTTEVIRRRVAVNAQSTERYLQEFVRLRKQCAPSAATLSENIIIAPEDAAVLQLLKWIDSIDKTVPVMANLPTSGVDERLVNVCKKWRSAAIRISEITRKGMANPHLRRDPAHKQQGLARFLACAYIEGDYVEMAKTLSEKYGFELPEGYDAQ